MGGWQLVLVGVRDSGVNFWANNRRGIGLALSFKTTGLEADSQNMKARQSHLLDLEQIVFTHLGLN